MDFGEDSNPRGLEENSNSDVRGIEEVVENSDAESEMGCGPSPFLLSGLTM